MRWMTRVGAIAFLLWGLLHLAGGAAMLATLTSDGAVAYLQLVAPSANHSTLVGNPGLDGTLGLHAWNLMLLGIVVSGVAVLLSWKGRSAGFWVNTVIVSGADVGLLALVVLPGYLPIGQALAGIVFWIVGVACSGIALFGGPRPSDGRS